MTKVGQCKTFQLLLDTMERHLSNFFSRYVMSYSSVISRTNNSNALFTLSRVKALRVGI